MSAGPTETGRTVFWNWVRVSTFGWWLGLGLIIVLVLAFGWVGEGGQFMVGVGMGAGVGFLQGRWIDQRIGSRFRWFWASTVGLGGPFVVHDLAAVLGVEIPYSLGAYVVVGSLVTGLLQWGLLRRHASRAAWWVPVSVAGWTVPVALAALDDRNVMRGVAGDAVSLLGLVFGGILLGAVTGGLLGRILVPPAGSAPSAAPPATSAP